MKLSHLLFSALAAGISFACTTSDTAPEATQQTPVDSAQALEVSVGTGMRKLHVKDGVYLGSQPTAKDLAWFKEHGVVSVINMRKADEMDFDQGQVCSQLGLSYANPGWNGPDELTDELFDTYRELLNKAEGPLLLHCASSNRVGPIWMAWRVLDKGADLEEALAEAETAGMRTPGYKTKALDYIARKRQ